MTNENRNFWINKLEKIEKFAETCKTEEVKISALKIADSIRKALND